MSLNELKVLILSGGPSGERQVSLQSGATVAEACRSLGCHVIESDILPNDHSALDQEFDVAFPLLHGSFGEDGQLQEILENRDILFVGSDQHSSRLCIDKASTKQKWVDHNLPTAPWISGDEISAGIPFSGPFVLKPNYEGSSLGVKFILDVKTLEKETNTAANLWDKLIIEPQLTGKELTVGIIDNQVLPVLEIKSSQSYYDYDAKYLRNDTQYSFDINLGNSSLLEVQHLAFSAYKILGCRHYGRIDLIYDETRGPQLLEMNTIPGFTNHSLFPKAAAQYGYSIKQLVERLLLIALKRY